MIAPISLLVPLTTGPRAGLYVCDGLNNLDRLHEWMGDAFRLAIEHDPQEYCNTPAALPIYFEYESIERWSGFPVRQTMPTLLQA